MGSELACSSQGVWWSSSLALPLFLSLAQGGAGRHVPCPPLTGRHGEVGLASKHVGSVRADSGIVRYASPVRGAGWKVKSHCYEDLTNLQSLPAIGNMG